MTGTAVSFAKSFGAAARSMEGIRATLGVARPASVRQIAASYVRDMVFDEPIITSDGVALGGHHTLTVRRDGSYRYTGHFIATALPSFDVAILTTLGFSVPVPGAASGAAEVTFAAHGHVHGSVEPGDRRFPWDQSGSNPLLATQWDGIRRAKFSHQLDFDTNWFGPVGDVVSFLAQVTAAGAVFGGIGVAVVMAGEAASMLNLQQVELPGLVGIISAAGAAFVLGPEAAIPAFLIGAAVTAATVKQRHLSDPERQFADKVFHGKIDFDRVLLSNLVGMGNRPFTTAMPGNLILVNLGQGCDHPTTYTGNGGADDGENAPGQLLIHELTHAWQICNSSFTPAYYCRAISTAAGTAGGNMSAYAYGPPGGLWGEFGTEQQASIVEHWFAGSTTKPKTNPNPQITFVPMDEQVGTPTSNPYFRYIRDNIRTGIS